MPGLKRQDAKLISSVSAGHRPEAPPFPVAANFWIGHAFMPTWILWLLLAALLVLPVLLRLYVGEELPNEITHEQPGDDDQDRDGDTGPALAA